MLLSFDKRFTTQRRLTMDHESEQIATLKAKP